MSVRRTNSRILTMLLETVARQSIVSQRKLASDLGVAVGLINLYIKRCVSKGLIKVEQVPSRRYAYFLTSRGFTEKTRLTTEYLSWSLTFFRRARNDCAAVMGEVHRRGWKSVGLAGAGDLCEIAMLCAAEAGVSVKMIVDVDMSGTSILGVAVTARIQDLSSEPDGWIVTATTDSQEVCDALVREVGVNRVLAPDVLSLGIRTAEIRI